jgi:hypothetical protein
METGNPLFALMPGVHCRFARRTMNWIMNLKGIIVTVLCPVSTLIPIALWLVAIAVIIDPSL